jgi:hypothetical protein
MEYHPSFLFLSKFQISFSRSSQIYNSASEVFIHQVAPPLYNAYNRVYPFTQYTGAVLPITVLAYIPGSTSSFAMQSSAIGDAFSPVANVVDFSSFYINITDQYQISAGTAVVFSLVDSLGRSGGNSGKLVSGLTDNTACLGQTQSSTSSSTSTSSATPSTPLTASPATSGGHLSLGAAAGIAVASLGFAGVVVFIALLFIRKRRRRRNRQSIDLT